jgi:beta-lactamase class A
MISISDNDAANAVYDKVGEANVNATLGRLGLGSTKLVNRFGDNQTTLDPGQNHTSPSDMVELLDDIATNSLINATTSADIRGLLATNTDRSKLARLLPPTAAIAHKSGWYTGVANDVGIVTAPGGVRWTIAVFLDGVSDDETGNQAIAAASRAVYDAWTGG